MPDSPTGDASRVLTALLRAVIAAEPVEAAVYAKYGVRLADLRALRVLHDLGEAPIGQFAEAVEIPRSTATIAVDRLERNGLVERVADTADRRLTRVRLMARGLAALRDCQLLAGSIIGRRVEALAPEQQRQLADLLEEVLDTAAPASPASGSVAPVTGDDGAA
ncbi:MAG TPA: MarR family transcriptional regulator [Thermomicrobiales bacterium]|nr:MarR family transcriptional regulator [Thermomicrobiales bacterium]